jgi:16S rRNA (adenine1518-N6/adenine1519-N6)-dimethyltransferase
VDPGVRDRIVAAAGLSSESLVVEIGPGTGILTEAMLQTGASVLAVELDRELARLLSERLAGNPRFAIRSADALEFDFAQALHDDPAGPRAVVITSRITHTP